MLKIRHTSAVMGLTVSSLQHLIQAFIFKCKLPISDYVNDMRSVVDQIPRLLAAMEYVAQEDKGSAGSLEMFSSFPIVRRIFQTGVMTLRAAAAGSISCPTSFEQISLSRKLEKGSTLHVGHLEIGFKIERGVQNHFHSTKKSSKDGNQSMCVSVVLGTLKGGYLLQTSSFIIPRELKDKFWTKKVSLDFDWNLAEANGGDDNCVLLRVLHEFAHTIDLELSISLDCPEC